MDSDVRLVFITAVGVGVWVLLGEPMKPVANWMYPNNSAPWEQVVGFFYPSESDPHEFIESPSLATVEACRNWAMEKVSEHGEHSRYECAIGKAQRWNHLHAFRLIIE